MFTSAEKKYLAMTMALLITGGGLKAYRLSGSRVGPFSAAGLSGPWAAGLPRAPVDSAAAASAARDSAGPDSTAPRDTGAVYQAGPQNPATAGKARDRNGETRARRVEGASGPVRLNAADAQQLVAVPGIGEKTAQAIVAFRHAHGPFLRLEDLLNVKGIGEKKLEKMRPWLRIAPADSLAR